MNKTVQSQICRQQCWYTRQSVCCHIYTWHTTFTL